MIHIYVCISLQYFSEIQMTCICLLQLLIPCCYRSSQGNCYHMQVRLLLFMLLGKDILPLLNIFLIRVPILLCEVMQGPQPCTTLQGQVCLGFNRASLALLHDNVSCLIFLMIRTVMLNAEKSVLLLDSFHLLLLLRFFLYWIACFCLQEIMN